jgi:esterase/lipase
MVNQPEVRPHLHALLFMSPNFRVRVPYDFLFTAPWARYFLPLISARREWEPINEAQARYWQYSYSTLAIIEMQKAVDWTRKQDLSTFDIPLAVMYMRNDPTIDPAAAIAAFHAWGSENKQLIEVEPDGDAPDHVFAGDICAPHRTEWTVGQFARFLRAF